MASAMPCHAVPGRLIHTTVTRARLLGKGPADVESRPSISTRPARPVTARVVLHRFASHRIAVIFAISHLVAHHIAPRATVREAAFILPQARL